MEIKNALITFADLSMADHGAFTLRIGIKFDQCVHTEIGGYALGHGYIGASQFEGSPKGIEEIMRIMDVVGVDRFSELEGKYIRIVDEGWNKPIKKFGNILEDKWFDYEEFYKNWG